MKQPGVFTAIRILAVLCVSTGFGVGMAARNLVPADLWGIGRVGELRLAPDGSSACFTVQRWAVETGTGTTQLWVLDVAGGGSRLLATVTGAGELSPAWSPDGRQIAYLARTAATPALYAVNLADGTAVEVTAPPLGAGPPQWLPDGRSLLFVTRVFSGLTPAVDATTWATTAAELARRRGAPRQVRVAEGGFYRSASGWLTDGMAHRIVRVGLADGRLTDLTPGYDRLFSPRGAPPLAVAPDGRALAVAVNVVAPDRAEENDDIMLLPTDGSGRWRNLTTDNPGGDNGPVFSPDGRFVLFGRRTETIYAGENTKLFQHELATGRNHALRPGADLSFSAWRYAADGRSILAVAERGGCTPAFRLAVDGTDCPAITTAGLAGDPHALPDGRVLLLHETFDHPIEVAMLRSGETTPRPLTALNLTALAGVRLGRVESREFQGAQGDRVQLWLVYPPGYDPGKKYPMVHLLHGGPHTMAGDSFSYLWNAHVFAARDVIVAMVNRHGSTGFGERFARAVIGDWREPACTDILRATDYLIAEVPAIDARRLAACGVSYGGYLAICLAGLTDRFACLVSHAGISDLYTQFGSDLAPHLSRTFGGFPWQDQERFARNNPVTQAANFHTPMLILQGGRDHRVPDGNAFALYGILQQRGVPSRLVYFPEEAHWVQSPQNSLVWHEEVFAWLDRWLLPP